MRFISRLVVLIAVALLTACGSVAPQDIESEGGLQATQLDHLPTTDGTSPTAITEPASTSTLRSVGDPPTPPEDTSNTLGVDPDAVSVLSVTDGDTLRVFVDGQNEPLRLIGINAPESGECLATEATRRLAELLRNGRVRLEMDMSDRDEFGRLLRYVYAGDVFVNEQLVREGLALARRYEPDTARSGRLEKAQVGAQEDGVGMWDPGACGPVTGARSVEIGQIHFDADGDDNQNLNDEWVEIGNPDRTALDLTGWSVKDGSATHRYHFPSGFHLEGGATVRLHTGCGADTSTALYWCSQGSAVWNNSGDTVFVLDPSGNVAASRSYSP